MSSPRSAADTDVPRARSVSPDDETVQLSAKVLAPFRAPADESAAPTSPVSWPVAAIAGGLVTAAAGWIIWGGLAVLGWLAADAGTLRDALVTGTNLWLLGNGVAAQFGSIPVTLVPWGATAVAAFLLHRSARVAARLTPDDQALGPVSVGMVVVVGYLVPVFAVTVFFGEPWLATGHVAAVVVVLALASVWGAAAGLGVPVTAHWPGWARVLPRAVLAGQLVLMTGGAAAMVTSLVLHRDRVAALTNALDPGALGGTALLAGQLAFAPNLCVWAASYALGAGFTLGPGSLVAPAGSSIGLLPSVPVLGALPAPGPGAAHLLWWLAVGVLAGAVAAALAVLARDAVRFDESSLVGGVAGALSGLLFLGLAWCSGGDLGLLRLTALGPRLQPLLVMAVSTLGLSGLITGLVLGLARRRSAQPREVTALDEETGSSKLVFEQSAPEAGPG